ncbi:unnamed protein product [Ascophyllum nodosum]
MPPDTAEQQGGPNSARRQREESVISEHDYHEDDEPSRSPSWESKTAGKPPPHSLPSEFRTNVEAGLRTALSTAIAFLWMSLGPFEGRLTFFTGVTAVICVGNSAGQSIHRSLQMTHGAVVAALCSVLPRFLMQWGPSPAGAGFFVAVFLVLRSRRLTTLGKKFACIGVTIITLADVSNEGFTSDWILFALDFVRTTVEGGVIGLLALLFPYPRYATGDVRARIEFMCYSLSLAVRSCVTGFIKGRDETSISRARLLCVQVRHHLAIVREELEWSKLELGLMYSGFFAGGLRLADTLEEQVELLDQVLQGVRGMRESLWLMHRTRAQASFAKVVGPAFQGVSDAIAASLEEMSTEEAWMPALTTKCCQRRQVSLPLWKIKAESAIGDDGDDDRQKEKHAARPGVGLVEGGPRRGAKKPKEGGGARAASSHPSKVMERLEEAVSRVMEGYNRARMEVIYGVDDVGRPLGDQHFGEHAGDDGSSAHRKPVPFDGFQAFSKRKPSPPTPIGVDVSPDLFTRPSEGVFQDGNKGAPGGTPNHVLVMQERQKLGSSATMARGAFMFSLLGLCKDLKRKRIDHLGGNWRMSDSTQAVRFVLSELWKALRPPPGLLKYVARAARCAIVRDRWPKARQELQHDGRGSGASGRGEGRGSGNGKERLSKRMPEQDRNTSSDTVDRSYTIWCLKVSISLTLCAAFRLSSYLDDVFAPAIWIPVTASFIMENKSASAMATILRRLIGTVLGAVYGIVTVKLSKPSDDNPYGYQAYAIVLPWVAVSSFFRNSPTFAHAALVAAFTAVVIFTGANTVLGADGETVSLARIVNTVVGSLIYLLVDMLLVPIRAKDLVHEQTYLALDAALKEIGINGERLFGVRVCPRKVRRQFIDRLRSSSEHGSFSLPRLVPALAHQDSGVHRTEQDGSLGSPEAVGQIWGWPLEVYHEEVSQENKSTATATKQAARASVSAEDGLTTSEGKRGDVENAAALAIGEEGARDSRVTSWSQRSKQRQVNLHALVDALEEQKKFLPLAELEPQLWYAPFPATAYHGMIEAQEELVRALSLMSRVAIAVSEDHSKRWREELIELGSHLASLVQLLKVGLEDARNVFSGRDRSEAFRGWDSSSRGGRQGIHLLDVQAEAIRLDSSVNADFVRYLQAFLDRGTFPALEMESILQVSTATMSVMGLQKALLMLGHAVATVLDRESFPHFYR